MLGQDYLSIEPMGPCFSARLALPLPMFSGWMALVAFLPMAGFNPMEQILPSLWR